MEISEIFLSKQNRKRQAVQEIETLYGPYLGKVIAFLEIG